MYDTYDSVHIAFSKCCKYVMKALPWLAMIVATAAALPFNLVCQALFKVEVST